MEVNDWDFTAVYFPAVDHFGHYFMDFHPPRQPHVSEQDFERYRHVMNLLRAMRGGKDYDAEFGKRLRGEGPYAWQIGRRFEIACKKLGLNETRRTLNRKLFVPPEQSSNQLSLF